MTDWTRLRQRARHAARFGPAQPQRHMAIPSTVDGVAYLIAFRGTDVVEFTVHPNPDPRVDPELTGLAKYSAAHAPSIRRTLEVDEAVELAAALIAQARMAADDPERFYGLLVKNGLTL